MRAKVQSAPRSARRGGPVRFGRRGTLAAAAVAVVACTAGPALAMSCNEPPSALWHIQQTDLIFRGVVVSSQVASEPERTDYGIYWRLSTTYRVTRWFKGPRTREVTIVQDVEGDNDRPEGWTVGEEGLVFAHLEDGEYETHPCIAYTEFPWSDYVQALREGRAHRPAKRSR